MLQNTNTEQFCWALLSLQPTWCLCTSNTVYKYKSEHKYSNAAKCKINTQSSLICLGEPQSTVHPANIFAQSTRCIRMHIATPGCVQHTLYKSKIRWRSKGMWKIALCSMCIVKHLHWERDQIRWSDRFRSGLDFALDSISTPTTKYPSPQTPNFERQVCFCKFLFNLFHQPINLSRTIR